MEVLKMSNPTKNDIALRNAGTVIINQYIPMLFERLGLIDNNRFTSLENQKKAVKYLQYVVTGMPNTDDAYLSLNKVLCGVPANEKISAEIDITDNERTLMNVLLQAIISHWSAIGDCSIEGFRGNWFLRDGMLSEYEDRWELMVEKRAYDILLTRSPFAFSIIKYPWMDKPLHVIWHY